jgi:hypothetical protein
MIRRTATGIVSHRAAGRGVRGRCRSDSHEGLGFESTARGYDDEVDRYSNEDVTSSARRRVRVGHP